jgi:hypothetical protein
MHLSPPAASSPALSVAGAVLRAAVLHATWNALAHGLKDKLVTFALIGLAYTACSAAARITAPWRPGRG